MKSLVLFALAMAAAAPLATAAHADRPTAVEVRFNDLDLNNAADAAVMLGRLNDAAMQACGAAPFASLYEYRLAVRRSSCYARSLSRAVAELNAPALNALYDREYGDRE